MVSRYSPAVRVAVLTRLLCAAILALGVGAPLAPAAAEPVMERTLYALLPLTPGQAREVAGLLKMPDVVLHDVADGGGALLHALPGLPDALVSDLLTAPSRHLALLHGVVTDLLELDRTVRGDGGVFRHTVRALHRSATLSAATGVLDRWLHPKNRTARLAIVLTARYHGLPVEDADLDLLRRAIDRDAPDFGPLVARVAGRLVQSYGRDAVRLLLLP
jgi:hypothetical protein